MYCKQCGKQISDQAKFCNFCGAKVTAEQPKPAPQPQPKPAAAAQPAQQTEAPKKKKGKVGIIIFIILIVLAIIGRYSEDHLRNGGSLSGDSGSSSSGISFGSDSGSSSLPDPTTACSYGALYKDGYLTFGHSRIYIGSYYYLLEDGGVTTDLLISGDDTTIFFAKEFYESGTSYDAVEGEDLIASLTSSGYTDIGMYEFKKYTVDGYPVIRYIAGVTHPDDGINVYHGELIIFPEKNPSSTIRLNFQILSEYGFGTITQAFDSLEISSAFELSSSDTNNVGNGHICVK